MGCDFSKTAKKDSRQQDVSSKKTDPPKSSITKPKLRKEDFMFKDQEKQLLKKEPGQINGQQFIIEHCVQCKIFLRDYTAAMNIYNCENCEIFLGPCAGSIYIRNSKNCKVIVATAQLRMYNCIDFTVLAFAISDPSIESCTNLKIGCFDYCYPELRGQFESAKLDIWNNVWSEVYDFTPIKGNYELMKPENATAKKIFSELYGYETKDCNLIPKTVGKSIETWNYVILILIMKNRKV